MLIGSIIVCLTITIKDYLGDDRYVLNIYINLIKIYFVM